MSTPAVTPQPDQFQYIKLPDGSYGKFRADASDDVIKGAISKDFPDAFKTAPTTWDKVKGYASEAGNAISDVAKGASQGMANTTAGVANMLGRGEETVFPKDKQFMDPILSNIEARRQNATRSDNNTQKYSKMLEQAGEMMLPGMAEESAIGKGATILPKMLYSAGTTGLINKAQGGDFATGAAAGAGGEILGAGMKKLAPKVAESALGVTGKLRGRGRMIGNAILDETNGIRPSTIAKQASGKIGELTGELNDSAHSASLPQSGPLDEVPTLRDKMGISQRTPNAIASTRPALNVIDSELSKAGEKNSLVTADKLNAVRKQLTEAFGSGEKIGPDVTPEKVLNLKRGIGDLVTSWTPEQKKGIQPILQRVYGALDNELDRTVPGADKLNQRISSLIPAAQRASKTAENAGTTQRILGRIARPTGALAGAALGYHEYGPKGAMIGLVAPELVTNPAVEMFGARALNSPIIPRMLVGAGLQKNKQ
jgi:hypothetical protein